MKNPLRLLFSLSIFVLFFGFNIPTLAQVSITCPPDTTVSNDPGVCEAVVDYTPPVGTGSGTNITTTLTDGLPPGASFPLGTTVVEYLVTNNEGDADVCSFTVTVEDTEAPVIDCPLDITVDADPGDCNQVVDFEIPTATDNCGPVNVIQIGGLPPGSAFPVGENFLDFQTTDAAGNNDFCRVIVFVNDIDEPEITCPDDITLTVTTACDTVVDYIAPVGSDDCLPSTTSQIAGLGPGASFPVGTTTETYEVTDQQGNSATCSFDVTVLDGAPPTFDDCPMDINQVAPPGDCEDVVNFTTPTASDNCPGVTVAQTEGPTSGSAFPVGTTTVEFTATDGSGNTAVCSFNVTITEDTDPEITCPDDIVVDNDPGICGAEVTYSIPEGTDNCPSPTTTLISGLGSGATFPVGTTTEIYEVTDLSGNTATCSFDITVNDSEAPVVDCPNNIVVNADPGTCETTATFPTPSFTDNCPGGTITQTMGPLSGSVFPVDTTTIEFTAIDDAGNQTICSFDVIVVDNELPEITCPPDINATIASGACDTLITYSDPTFSDNCPDASLTQVSGPASGSILEAGSYTVVYEVEDASGNTAQCSFTIDIAESNPPVFDCPEDITVNADPGTCQAVVTFDNPTASDPCSDVTVTQTGGPASGSVFPAGPTTIEFTAEDEFGNTEICTFVVTVVDDIDPTITCPEDITQDNDPGICGAVITYDLPTADDNCGVDQISLISGPASGDEFPVGITTVTYEVADVSGNTAECTFEVEVVDVEAPVLNCPDDILINLPDGVCEEVVTYSDPTATDNCAVETLNLISGPASGELFQTGTTTITYEATDAAGNVGTCSFTVTLLESVDPEITCPNDTTVSAEAGVCGAIVVYEPPAGTDDCAVESTELTGGLGSGSFFSVGTTVEEYTVTDLSGNTAVCTFTVTVEDNEAPVFECLEDITVPNEPGLCEAVVDFSDPVVNDNCDGELTPTQTAGPSSGSAFSVGTTTITYEATDNAGNVASCSFNVIVEDTEPPVITCPNDTTVNAGLVCSTVVDYALPTATDNCNVSAINLIEGPASGSEFSAGVTTVTYEAIDDAGNSVECSFTVTVIEDAPPTIDCPEDISTSTDPGECSAVVDYDLPTGEDDCSEVSISLISGFASGDAFPLGTTTVTYEAEDESGNTATCTFDVTVADEEAPVFDCPEDIDLPTDLGVCTASYTFINPSATDNCSEDLVVIQTEGPVSGTDLPVGVTTFSFETTDESGNVSTCSYTVTVSDNEEPIFSECPESIEIQLTPDACDTAVVFDDPIATDNCGLTLEQIAGPQSGETLSVGTYSVEFTATDDAGNTGLCQFDISVTDITPPVLICPDTLESCDVVVDLPIPTATDSCGVESIVQIEGPESGTPFPTGFSTITFEATDVNGNSSTCSYVVEVFPQTTRPETGPNRSICDENSTTLNGNLPQFGTGLWYIIEGEGEIVSPNNSITQVTGLAEGVNTFVWSINPDNGCDILTDTVSIFVEEGVLVEAGEDQNIVLGGDADLSGTVFPPDGTIEWDPNESLTCGDCLNPIATPDETTLYFLTYTTPLGCELTDSVLVKVFIEIPNTITPDGDGVNDTWNIPEIDEFPDVTVQIYNRWGVEVFSSSGYNEPWGGSRDGEELPTGSYYYIIDYNQEGKENLNGTVNIIR